MEISAVALKGKKFGRLTVLKILERIGHDRFILCRCECGSTLEVRKSCLKSGNTRSCGCLQREEARAKRLRHGHTIGGKKTKEHRAWLNIKSRCLGRDPHKRKYYKDRGITISRKLSNSFEAFLKEVGLAPSPNHSIERINNSVGYEAGNIRWATTGEQCRNKRNNVLITIDGKTMCLRDWANSHAAKVGEAGIRQRLKRGWSAKKAVVTPPLK